MCRRTHADRLAPLLDLGVAHGRSGALYCPIQPHESCLDTQHHLTHLACDARSVRAIESSSPPKARVSSWQVEISEGHDNEDFHLSARVNAFDGYSPSAMSSYTRDVGDTTSVFLRAVLSGLSPSSDFDVRVAPISRCAERKKFYSSTT